MTTITAVADREALRTRFHAIRSFTEALAAPLRPEDQVVQSMPDVSPTKWHRAHTTWFFETFLLEPALTGYAPFDPDYGYLFNSYYEAVGPRHPRPQRGLLSRPTVDEVARYRAHVDAAMDEADRRCDAEAWPALGADRARSAPRATAPRAAADGHQARAVAATRSTRPTSSAADVARHRGAPVRMLDVDGGLVEIGHDGTTASRSTTRRRATRVYLEPFRIADRLVTAGEWLEFIADGGYQRPELWLSDGWYAVQEHGWDAPLYWRDDDADGWIVFTLGGRRPRRPGRAGRAREPLRSRRVRALARRAAPDRVRVGARGRRRSPSAACRPHRRRACIRPATGGSCRRRRRVAVDRERVPALPAVRARGRRGR